MRSLLVLLVILFIVLQYKLWFGQGGVTDTFRLKGQVVAEKTENAKIQQENAILIADVEALKKSPQVVEERARSGLGMIKDGEVFYQVVS